LQFKPEYYSSVEGGCKAAQDLKVAVSEHLKSHHPDLVNQTVVVKAVANDCGLSQMLRKAGVANPAGSLRDFSKGFSQAFITFDFVLVDVGKDRADKKIEGK
jgi:hypothetical protein